MTKFCGYLAGLLGLLALTAQISPSLADCTGSGIGMSRQVTVDTRGGPRFGHVQYPGPEFLQKGEIVLTFDDGPHKQLTPVILDILDAHCVKATFFMVGQRALLYPGLVQEVVRRGHTVGTHTWAHRDIRKLPTETGIAEIELGISGVQRALGRPAAPFFRFPYLSDPAYATQHLRQRNTAIFSIDVDSLDFRTRSPTVMMRNVTSQLATKHRGIILFHDIQPSTAGGLNGLLSNLKTGGYKVVHLRPQAQQVTLAAYDQTVATKKLGSISSGATPLAHRTIVAPAWEPRIVPAPLPHQVVQTGPSQAAPVVLAHPERQPRAVRSDDDWRVTVFKGY